MNGKRRQFPRFYFVSKSDLLDILSNGSNPRKILSHINKVFLQTDTLGLEGGTKSDERPTAVKWTAAVGVEEVIFQPAVPLAGKVEIYLQTVLDAQRATLKRTLEQSIGRYPSQVRTEWLMNKVNGKPSDPAQISLLVRMSLTGRPTTCVGLYRRCPTLPPSLLTSLAASCRAILSYTPPLLLVQVSGMEYVKSMEASFDALVGGDAEAMKRNYKKAEDVS